MPSLAGVFIDFLGRPAYTLVGPARLAVSTGVPIVVTAMLRRGDGYVAHVNDPIFPDPTRPREEEVLRLTLEWSRQIQELIRRHPEQWPWFHNRWKTTPEKLAARNRRTLRVAGVGTRPPGLQPLRTASTRPPQATLLPKVSCSASASAEPSKNAESAPPTGERVEIPKRKRSS